MLPKKKNLEEERAKHTVDSLYKDYVDDLFSYALGFGFDKQTAMDAIHDVFAGYVSEKEKCRRYRILNFTCCVPCGTS